ncbi:MAG: hypothetical protein NT085_05000 [candidate division SR1 bacterium]|nr:hypothetical protein [candidate division SR1 bacterium]
MKKNPGTIFLFIGSFGLFASSFCSLFGVIGLIISCVLYIGIGIWLFRRRGYWVDMSKISNTIPVRINKHGLLTVMNEKRFFVNLSDRMIYLNSGLIQMEFKTAEFSTKDPISFHSDINALVQMKNDEASVLNVANTKEHLQSYQDYIISNEPFKKNREIVEAKMREFIATKTFDEINPALHKETVIKMLNDLFVQDFMVVNVTDIEVVIP